MHNVSIPKDILDTTYIGLEYKLAQSKKFKYNTRSIIYFLGVIFISFSAFYEFIPAYFGRDIFTVITILVWVLAGIGEMWLEGTTTRNNIRYDIQRLHIEIESEFQSDDPDLTNIKPKDVQRQY